MTLGSARPGHQVRLNRRRLSSTHEPRRRRRAEVLADNCRNGTPSVPQPRPMRRKSTRTPRMQLAARRQAVRPAKSCGANLSTADVRATAASRADCNGPLTAIAALVADDGLTMSLEI